MTLIRGTSLAGFPELVAELGGDAAALLSTVGVSADAVGDYTAFIDYVGVVRALEAAARATGELDFGRRLAERQGVEIFGPVGIAARSASTFGEAVETYVRYLRAYSPAIHVGLVDLPDPSVVFWEFRVVLDRLPRHPQESSCPWEWRCGCSDSYWVRTTVRSEFISLIRRWRRGGSTSATSVPQLSSVLRPRGSRLARAISRGLCRGMVSCTRRSSRIWRPRRLLRTSGWLCPWPNLVRTIKPALPEIIRNSGYVLITASVYAFFNGVVNSAYASSKAAVEMLGRSLRVELASVGASAGVLYPGWVATPIADSTRGGNESVTQLKERAFRGPLGPYIEPEQIADAVVTGIEARAPRIIEPKRWSPLSAMRGVINILADRHLERDHVTLGLIKRIDAEERQRQARRETAPQSGFAAGAG